MYKKGQKNILTNYRPISILPVIDKVFEELVLTRLISFLNLNNILCNKQYGFRKGKCINDLFGDFCDKVNRALNNNCNVLITFIDFSKAFDTLNHKKLITKIYNIGIRGVLLKWLHNYLTNRFFSVKIGDKISAEKPVSFGVPQGSKLGPLLFIIYINDLLRMLKANDDISIIVDHLHLNEAVKQMQKYVDICI